MNDIRNEKSRIMRIRTFTLALFFFQFFIPKIICEDRKITTEELFTRSGVALQNVRFLILADSPS